MASMNTFNPIRIVGEGVSRMFRGAAYVASETANAVISLKDQKIDLSVGKTFTDPERFHFFGAARDNFANTKVRVVEAAQSLVKRVSGKNVFEGAIDGLKNNAADLRKEGMKAGFFNGISNSIGNVVLTPIYGIANFAKRTPIIFAATTAFAGYKLFQRWQDKKAEKELGALQAENAQLEGQLGQLAQLSHAPRAPEMYNPLAEGKTAQHFQNMVASNPSHQVMR